MLLRREKTNELPLNHKKVNRAVHLFASITNQLTSLLPLVEYKDTNFIMHA